MAETNSFPLDSPWKLTRPLAELRLAGLLGELDVDAPRRGIGSLRLGHEAVPGSLLQVSFASAQARPDDAPCPETPESACVEAYVRCVDVVATYSPLAGFPFRSQIYWRSLPLVDPVAIAAIEAIVSTQTELLDSHPRVSVSTTLPAVELWRLTSLDKAEFKQISLAGADPQQIHYSQGPGCYLWRLSGDRWSFAEMLPPGDFHSTDIQRDAGGVVTLSHRLFGRSLEKGVILRSRVRGVLLDRARDAHAAMAWYRDLLCSELPLTT